MYPFRLLAGFVVRSNHSRCLLIVSLRCSLKYKNENFEYFCRQNQNHKINTFTCVGDGVANNLNDASHLPHLAESFLILCCTSCELAEGSPRRNYTFTPSRPGIVRTLKRAESGEMCEILVKLHTCTLLVVYMSGMYTCRERYM